MMRKRQRRPMSAEIETLEVQQESIDAYHISRVNRELHEPAIAPSSWLTSQDAVVDVQNTV